MNTIKFTKYPPQFAYKHLLNLLESFGLDYVKGNASYNTNSYYIEIEQGDIMGDIRISDHAHPKCELQDSYIVNELNKGLFDVNIITKEGYKKAKEFLNNLFNNQ